MVLLLTYFFFGYIWESFNNYKSFTEHTKMFEVNSYLELKFCQSVLQWSSQNKSLFISYILLLPSHRVNFFLIYAH